MGIEFNNESDFQQSYAQSSGSKGMTGWLIKKGWVKDEKSAQIVLIVIAVICFAVAIFFAIK